MAITDKKVSETYAGRDISSLSDRPNQDGLTGAQLKARFDQLGKEVIPKYNDLIDELNDTVLPSKADQSTTYTKTESDSLLGGKVDKVTGKSLVDDSAITDLTDGLDSVLHKHDTMYYTEAEIDVLLATKSDTGHTHDDIYYTETDGLLDDKVDKVVGSSLVADSVMTDLTDLGDSSAHYHATDRNTDNHTDGTTNKVFSATEKTKLAGIETGAEVNNISDVNATDLTDSGDTTLHTHKSIVNEVSVDNAKVEALSTGVKITRNINDANTALQIDQQHVSSTGLIADFMFNGVSKASVDRFGKYSGTVDANKVVNVPAGDITSTDVQGALAELDTKAGNVVVGADGKRYQALACVLRNTAGTWGIIDDAGHAPVGVASVSADSTAITLTYNFTSAKIGSLVCTPDETYVADGLSFGASVGDTTATIKASINKMIGGYIFYNGSAWDFSLAPGVTSVEWTGGGLKINHGSIYQPVNFNCTIAGRGGVVTPVFSTTIGAISETYALIDFYDWAGTKITTPNSNMKFMFNRVANGLVNPLLLTQSASNIWVYGLFEIA